MPHLALNRGAVATITGGAAGIGLAAAKRFAQLGLCVCIADLNADRLRSAAEEIAVQASGRADDVLTVETDVSRVDDLCRLEAAVRNRFGGTDILMNNAGIQTGSDIFGSTENWQRVPVSAAFLETLALDAMAYGRSETIASTNSPCILREWQADSP